MNDSVLHQVLQVKKDLLHKEFLNSLDVENPRQLAWRIFPKEERS